MVFYSQNRIRLGFVAVLATILAVAVISYKSLKHTLEQEAQVAESQQGLRAVQEGLTALWSASTGAYEYALTGSPEALQTYNNGIHDAGFTGITRTAPAAKEQGRLLKEIVDARQREDMTQVMGLLKSQRGDEINAQLHVIAEKERFDRLMQSNAQLKEAEQSGQQTFGIIMFGFGVAFCVVLASFGVVMRDYAERQRTAAQVQQSEERFRALLRNTSDIIAVISPEGEVRYISPALERILGFTPEEVTHSSFLNLLSPSDKEEALQSLRGVALHPQFEQRVEWSLESREGKRHTCEACLSNRVEDPLVEGILITLRDISERLGFQEQLEYQAYHDPLTKLPNRACLMDRLQQSIARSARQESALALVFVDLDNFKVINDSMGHEAGDSLLKAISERLKDAVRHGDTVARLGGDEFVLLLEDILSEEDATLVAERIQQNLVSPMEIAGREIFGSASVGIAFCRGGNTDAESIMRDADTAMYHAKTNGKAGYALFHPRMNIQVVERLEMEHALRLALENKELHLVYQPIMSLENQSVREVEALLRWTHPERGLISPVKFIPVAEETGLIIPIGRWVLEQACRQAKEWEAEVPDTSSLIMGVNVSAKQLQQSDFVEMVLETLGQARLTPSRLKIEITESLMMSNIEDSQRKLTALKEVGVHVAVDDFGTGYASMAYLSTLPIDTLKIDRSFVQRLNQQAEHSAVVGAIISLANSLGITVTSEGIETPEQLSTLVAMGVPLGQGFYFSKPLTSADFRAYLQGVDCWHAQETVRRVA